MFLLLTLVALSSAQTPRLMNTTFTNDPRCITIYHCSDIYVGENQNGNGLTGIIEWFDPNPATKGVFLENLPSIPVASDFLGTATFITLYTDGKLKQVPRSSVTPKALARNPPADIHSPVPETILAQGFTISPRDVVTIGNTVYVAGDTRIYSVSKVGQVATLVDLSPAIPIALAVSSDSRTLFVGAMSAGAPKLFSIFLSHPTPVQLIVTGGLGTLSLLDLGADQNDKLYVLQGCTTGGTTACAAFRLASLTLSGSSYSLATIADQTTQFQGARWLQNPRRFFVHHFANGGSAQVTLFPVDATSTVGKVYLLAL